MTTHARESIEPSMHLLVRLRTILDGSPRVVISAPRGAGKSRVLAQWASAREREGDTVSWGPRHVAGATAVVLDEPSERDLRAVLDAVPAACRVVVATRRAPTEVMEWHLRLRESAILLAGDLRLTLADIAAVLRGRGLPDDAEAVAAVARASHGIPWFVDIACEEVAESAREKPDPDFRGRDVRAGRLARAVDDAVVSALRETVPAEELSLLAIPVRLDDDGIAALGTTSELISARAALAEGGWVEHLGASGAPRLVPPVRRALARRVRRGASPTIESARARLVTRLLGAERLAEAWAVAREGGSDALSWRVLMHAIVDLDSSLLASMTRDIRAAFLSRTWAGDALALWTSAYNIGIEPVPRAIVERALDVRDFDQRLPDAPVGRLSHAGLTQVWRRRAGDVRGTAVWAARTVEIWEAQRARLDPGQRGHGALALQTTGLTYLRLGRWAAAAAAFAEAEEIAAAQGAVDFAATITEHLALALALAGEIRRAQSAMARLSAVQGTARSSYTVMVVHLVEALLALEDGDAERAASALARVPPERLAASEIGTLAISIDAYVRALLPDVVGRPPVVAITTDPLAVSVADATADLVDLVSARPVVLSASRRARMRGRVVDHWGVSAAVVAATRGGERIGHPRAGATESPRERALADLVRAALHARTGEERGARKALRDYYLVTQASGLTSAVRLLPESDRVALAAFAMSDLPDLAASLGDLSSMPSVVPTIDTPPVLTTREREVLDALASGLSRAQMADAWGVSMNTIKTHARGLYAKLSATSKEDVLVRAEECGLLG
ncbi:LuxR C-terminal-related transcriptional regulator [Microbacterium excoecariae]|uniref:LuxR C-terminal-related transcriptional regulator n=1 Tax=Microbacterium excoecariae TaxID=2715210 RepID=UPI0014083312|nr:LuxR C-terminal-related transcriptional regulator [Microbacterium excoecariae]NHI16080.1 helix-turn-helix transcriptional regulator [Microbacterium excoecariae]